MYVTLHEDAPGKAHVHLTLEHGPNAGTWEVRFEPTWLVRSPEGRELALSGTDAWMGELARELESLVKKGAPRAVAEAVRRDRRRAAV